MTTFLLIAVPTVALMLILVGWGWWTTRKPWVVHVNMDDRPDYYKRIEQELRDGR